ncbi:zinc-ribbon domain-containing protein [Marinovum sp.]|uniref:zinc-ribbon domain-containing protein n=1 Tax=Marinovum sp. TaxID=2024839 RepID=UPI002B26C09A|nr:zinc-ribbon domain-containing protein [Marinovum sp.]
MRLTCPNCDAQYEVPDEVIPPEGRDVQCSACGKTWFQTAAAPPEDADFDQARHSARPEPEAEPDPEPEPAPEMQTEPRPRQLDPEVASVLREEAERESRVREAERGAVESQPDLGLDDMSSDGEGGLRARQSRDRMARLRGEDPEEPEFEPKARAKAVAAAAAHGSRRELLPDIEEINSTLRSTDQPRKTEISEEIAAEPERTARSHFRRGFSWVLLLVAVAALVYAYSPQIAQLVPGLEPALDSYVVWVNGLRGWLDARVLTALQWLDGMSSEATQTPG